MRPGEPGDQRPTQGPAGTMGDVETSPEGLRVGEEGPPSNAAPRLTVDEERRRRLRPWAIVGAAAVTLVCGSIILSYTPIFRARVVEVEGEDRLAPRQVMRLAGVTTGTNVVHLDQRAVEARLEGEPWIAEATVDTRLPGTITIAVRERVPALVLETPDGRRLVAADGTDLGHAPRTVPLPTVGAAEGASLDRAGVSLAGQTVRAMAPELRSRLDRVTVTTDDGLMLTVDGGIEVHFGSAAEAVAKAQALRAILDYADEEHRALLSVDLSVPGAPTAVFVGSQQPVSMPDPSADLATDPSEDDAHVDDADAGAGDGGDPSPSA